MYSDDLDNLTLGLYEKTEHRSEAVSPFERIRTMQLDHYEYRSFSLNSIGG